MTREEAISCLTPSEDGRSTGGSHRRIDLEPCCVRHAAFTGSRASGGAWLWPKCGDSSIYPGQFRDMYERDVPWVCRSLPGCNQRLGVARLDGSPMNGHLAPRGPARSPTTTTGQQETGPDSVEVIDPAERSASSSGQRAIWFQLANVWPTTLPRRRHRSLRQDPAKRDKRGKSAPDCARIGPPTRAYTSDCGEAISRWAHLRRRDSWVRNDLLEGHS